MTMATQLRVTPLEILDMISADPSMQAMFNLTDDALGGLQHDMLREQTALNIRQHSASAQQAHAAVPAQEAVAGRKEEPYTIDLETVQAAVDAGFEEELIAMLQSGECTCRPDICHAYMHTSSQTKSNRKHLWFVASTLCAFFVIPSP